MQRGFDRITECNDKEAMKELVDYLAYMRFGDEAQKVLASSNFEVETKSHLAHRLRVLSVHDAIIQLKKCENKDKKPAVREAIREMFDDLQARLSGRYCPRSGGDNGSVAKPSWLDMQIAIAREAVFGVLLDDYSEGCQYSAQQLEHYRAAINNYFPEPNPDPAAAAAAPPAVAAAQLAYERKTLLEVLQPDCMAVDNVPFMRTFKEVEQFSRELQTFLDTLEESTIPLPNIIVRRETAKAVVPVGMGAMGNHSLPADMNPQWGLGVFASPNFQIPGAAELFGEAAAPQPATSGKGKRKAKAAAAEDPAYVDKRKRKKVPPPKSANPKKKKAAAGTAGTPAAGAASGTAATPGAAGAAGTPGAAGAPAVPGAAPAATGLGRARRNNRRRVRFTTIEIDNLRRGVEEFGIGKWEDIRRKYWFNERTNVDLKDKWRNMGKMAAKEDRIREAAAAAATAAAAAAPAAAAGAPAVPVAQGNPGILAPFDFALPALPAPPGAPARSNS